ncbi:AAI domain-containing protein [Citrus sinensis]|nr:AAI domain-containing protein [Citrus sinensis]GAY46911.1 hypothetical protein CUMW_100600 [Citrus unshiu]
MQGKNKARVMLVVLVVAMILNGHTAAAAQCRVERRMLVNACKSLVFRIGPSAKCCERLRATRTQCVCSVITPTVAKLIDVNYAVKVVRQCGRYVPRHFKCGSITTP